MPSSFGAMITEDKIARVSPTKCMFHVFVLLWQQRKIFSSVEQVCSFLDSNTAYLVSVTHPGQNPTREAGNEQQNRAPRHLDDRNHNKNENRNQPRERRQFSDFQDRSQQPRSKKGQGKQGNQDRNRSENNGSFKSPNYASICKIVPSDKLKQTIMCPHGSSCTRSSCAFSHETGEAAKGKFRFRSGAPDKQLEQLQKFMEKRAASGSG